MAIDPLQYQTQGQQYAAGMAASQDPFINLYKQRLGSMKSREALAAEIANLYAPAIQSAQGVGANVAGVGQAGLAAISGLASALPGADVGGLAEAYRGAARAGGSAALVGTALETGARQGLAESILQQQMASQQEQFGTQEKLAGSESERARLAADWLGAAQGFQGMAQTAQQMQFAEDTQPLELEKLRQDIASIMANTEYTDQQKANLIAEMGYAASPETGTVAQNAAALAATQAQTAKTKEETKYTKVQTGNLKKMGPVELKNAILSNQKLRGDIAAGRVQLGMLTKELGNAGVKLQRTSNGGYNIIDKNTNKKIGSIPASVSG